MYNLDVYGNSPHKKQTSILADIVASNEISGPGTLSLCLDLVCGCSQLRSEGRLFASRCPIICMSCHSLSAAGESIRMLYVGSGGGLWLHGCVPWREFSFLLVWHLRSKLQIFSISMSFSSGVTVDMASDILRSGSSDARLRDSSCLHLQCLM